MTPVCVGNSWWARRAGFRGSQYWCCDRSAQEPLREGLRTLSLGPLVSNWRELIRGILCGSRTPDKVRPIQFLSWALRHIINVFLDLGKLGSAAQHAEQEGQNCVVLALQKRQPTQAGAVCAISGSWDAENEEEGEWCLSGGEWHEGDMSQRLLSRGPTGGCLVTTHIQRFKFMNENHNDTLITLRMSFQKNCRRRSLFGGSEKPEEMAWLQKSLGKPSVLGVNVQGSLPQIRVSVSILFYLMRTQKVLIKSSSHHCLSLS